MAEKVLLVLVDGMRPDALTACGSDDLINYYKSGTYCLESRTVFPSITLPCHMSLFHSVDPERHGVYNNTFIQQNHPVQGLIEQIRAAGKKSAFFYMWENLRDLATPEKVSFTWYMCYKQYGDRFNTDTLATKACIEHIRELAPDFAFLYLGATDETGHAKGWMGEEYLAAVKHAGECIKEVTSMLPDDYSVIVTADHGGHGRNHGTMDDVDMTIPICFHGKRFPAGKAIEGVNIKDLAPTIVDIMGVEKSSDWEGHSVFEKM